MKDVVIKKESVRLALWLCAACLIVAVGLNAGAIVAYHRPWTELFTQIGYTLCIAFGLWLLSLVAWGIVLLIKRIL